MIESKIVDISKPVYTQSGRLVVNLEFDDSFILGRIVFPLARKYISGRQVVTTTEAKWDIGTGKILQFDGEDASEEAYDLVPNHNT